MKKHLFVAAVAMASVYGAFAQKSADAVLMTVDGHDIRVSEFEYLYDKNNNQQLEPQTLDQYLDMFINYKLKVADAEHAGIPETPDFLKEFKSFRNDLAAPYMIDKSVEDALVNEAFGHRANEVYVSHIMVAPNPESKARLDSIRTEILAGTVTFEDAAKKWSIDQGSSQRGGRMGYVTPDRFPWAFEKASYDTPVGELSPIVYSGMGYHIIRPESNRPAEGEVNASHILLMTRGMSPKDVELQRNKIDSIYTLIQGGADFAELAKKFSEDPGSASKGGSLGWFGRGMMVAEFDSVSFALANGEVSKPFQTGFGYHIIKRFDSRKPASELTEETRKALLARMNSDERGTMARDAKTREFMAKYFAKVDEKGMAKVRDFINANAGGYDSTTVAALGTMDIAVATFKGGEVTIADVMTSIEPTQSTNVDNAMRLIGLATNQALENAVLNAVRDDLAVTNTDYRNLVNEYRDGILLYEISNRNVWDKAAKDKEGLESFFKANIDRYKWDQPKFKSYIFFAQNDSILDEALKYAATIDSSDPAKFTAEMRSKFKRNLKIERVIAAKGENAITDFLGFGAERPVDENKSHWKHYAAFNGRVIDMPEEAADVRGAAVTDYQALLEKNWLNDLHKKYKVKVNKKAFEKLKKSRK